jgi:hypothetical protein
MSHNSDTLWRLYGIGGADLALRYAEMSREASARRPAAEPESPSAAHNGNAGSAPASAPSPPSTPSLGSLLGKVLLTGLAALIENSVNGQSNAGASFGAQAEPEIGPGRWQFQLTTHPGWNTVLAGADVYFDPAGSLFGSGLLCSGGQRMPCQIGGRWQYDPYAQVLTVDPVIDGRPTQRDRLQLVGGGNGQYQMVNGAGHPFHVVRLA